jgi:hypothetical protein
MSPRPLILPLVLASSFSCDAYDPPPKIADLGLDRGIFDPKDGPIRLQFSEPITVSTLSISIWLDRRSHEKDLCIPEGESLPDGCSEEAVRIAGPCEANPANAIRDAQADGSVGFSCDDGIMLVSSDRRSATFEAVRGLIPFERYILELAPGLSDDLGRAQVGPIREPFQVKAEFELAPTDFPEGMFFTVFDIVEPVPIQFHFAFWFEVNSDTGEIKLFGADLDPNDPDVTDTLTDRDIANWHTDPNPPTGATIMTKGQIADGSDGRVLRIFPFQLTVTSPAIDAAGVELSGRFGRRAVEGAPPPEREVAEATIYSPRVSLGGESQLGEGRGTAFLFRLTEEETLPLAEILPEGMTVEDVRNSFAGE